jgi:hypothetical protein
LCQAPGQTAARRGERLYIEVFSAIALSDRDPPNRWQNDRLVDKMDREVCERP